MRAGITAEAEIRKTLLLHSVEIAENRNDRELSNVLFLFDCFEHRSNSMLIQIGQAFINQL